MNFKKFIFQIYKLIYTLIFLLIPILFLSLLIWLGYYIEISFETKHKIYKHFLALSAIVCPFTWFIMLILKDYFEIDEKLTRKLSREKSKEPFKSELQVDYLKLVDLNKSSNWSAKSLFWDLSRLVSESNIYKYGFSDRVYDLKDEKRIFDVLKMDTDEFMNWAASEFDNSTIEMRKIIRFVFHEIVKLEIYLIENSSKFNDLDLNYYPRKKSTHTVIDKFTVNEVENMNLKQLENITKKEFFNSSMEIRRALKDRQNTLIVQKNLRSRIGKYEKMISEGNNINTKPSDSVTGITKAEKDGENNV